MHGGSTAYSTLGYFADPVLNTMIEAAASSTWRAYFIPRGYRTRSCT